MGKKHKRAINGIVLLDKPMGLSSNQALQKVKRLYCAAKAGHTGSLDPLATGMLPLCFGEATKIAGHLLGSDKAYEVTAQLGITTNTDDAEGEITARADVPVIDVAPFERLLAGFIGKIPQVPPAFSALKRDGVPMYVRARRGEDVALEARQVHIESIRLLAVEPSSFRLEVTCGSGTYIRSLVRDIGQALGCGAHVTALRRQWVHPFADYSMVTMDELLAFEMPQRDAHLVSMTEGLANWPRVCLNTTQTKAFSCGQPLWLPDLANDDYCAFADDGRLLALAKKTQEGYLRVVRGFNLPKP